MLPDRLPLFWLMPVSRVIGILSGDLLAIVLWTVVTLAAGMRLYGQNEPSAAQRRFDEHIQPLIQQYCFGCHSTEKQKGDLDLERYTSQAEVLRHPKPWEQVVEQLTLGEMPPAEKPQPTPDERRRLLDGINALLDEAALARAGDPGPVMLRRLNNAEYAWTVRDLTGVASLDPAREFPADSAAGEGFMNTGNALVMSPALLTKYFDAAKDIAAHAVLLPAGIRFSPGRTERDWTEETLSALRAFYARFTESGGGTSVNLQGIRFDTRDGGVLPLEKYLEATLALRANISSLAPVRAKEPGARPLFELAADRGLSPRYLAALWNALTSTNASLLFDPIRKQWRDGGSGEAASLAKAIQAWQQALWRFTTVGHIGKRDGPKAWQAPVTPLAESREIRLKLPAPAAGNEVMLYLAVSDAGDGNEHDFALWENPRLVAPGRPDLLLRDVRDVMNGLTADRDKVFAGAAKCLAAAAETGGSLQTNEVAELARKHGVEPWVLGAWLDCLGIGAGEARIDGHIKRPTESAQGYGFIKGWAGDNALSVIANSSDQHVRVPGNMKPHSVAVHPSPDRRVIVAWRSPVAAAMRVEGRVQHAHPECGNGVTWALELRRGNTRQRLGAGTAQGSRDVSFGPFENLAVQPGDVISAVIGPRDGNHSCDLTAVDFILSDGTRAWNLAKDVSPDILAGNPHADSFGHEGVWHFHSEPAGGSGAPALPAGSLLARWQSSQNGEEKQRLAAEVGELLLGGAADLPKDAPDAVLYRELDSPSGPLLNALPRSGRREAPGDTTNDRRLVAPDVASWGLDPAFFGRHVNGAKTGESSLCVQAPAVIEVRLPAELAEGCEFVAAARLHPAAGTGGSVQMRALTTKPAAEPGLAAGALQEQGSKSTWSDGERPVVSDSPVIAVKGSAAWERVETAFDEFRQLFPAALCYTKIVPVDEVVTLTLFYREDDHLRRLMLDETQAAELDRLWAELHYVSQDALKLVDAFEQLWQFATQDADPSAFEPLREPIKRRAEEFRKLLLDTQPAHLEAVLRFAEGAYRRPLTAGEIGGLRALYRRLRDEEISHGQAIRLTLARILVAPAFLYRAEQPPPGDQPGPVTDWELATRLSYFLWSSAPDAELLRVAAAGELGDPGKLAAQARRMLQDDRVRRLATEFGCAWLHIHDFKSLDEKSERHFPAFAALRGPMYEEVIRFFTDVFQNDLSVLTIFDADHTFLNEALAGHYGIPDVTGPEWRRVDGVREHGRGGILGLGATLSKQSGASRTSPILRGNWVAEVLLGDKLPRPPKDVPNLPEDEAAETLTVRHLTEKHSSDPRCYGCHRRIDGYGFALEAYDAIGRLRSRDMGGRPIETRAKVFDGTVVDDAQGLRDYLLTKRRDAILRQFNRKLLGYALGRGVMLSDKPLLAQMQRQLETHDYRFSAAVEVIVLSPQFRQIRGREMAGEE